MQEFIHKLKQKPVHVRHRIAMGTSIGITALVGVIWVAAMASSGTFALNTNPTTATDNGQAPSSDAFALSGTNVKSNFSQLVGAVGAVTGATTSQPALTIVDGSSSSSINQPSSQTPNPSATVIPF